MPAQHLPCPWESPQQRQLQGLVRFGLPWQRIAPTVGTAIPGSLPDLGAQVESQGKHSKSR